MSQRMTDRSIRFDVERIELEAKTEGANMALSRLEDELVRARSEEARLLEENRKQAEQIKALADALEAAKMAMWRGEFGDKGRDRDVPTLVDAALHLVGRMK